MAKRKVRLLTSFAGVFAGHDSPSYGQMIEVDEQLAATMIEDGRAEADEPEARTGKRTTERAVSHGRETR